MLTRITEFAGVRSSVGGPHGEVTIDGLHADEVDMLRAAMLGAKWVRCVDGRLRVTSAYAELPAPAADPCVGPYWEAQPHQLHLFDFGEADRLAASYPSITVRGLCGYNFSRDLYKQLAARMESYGFECLRSRRGDDGKFSEVWELSSLSLARGELSATLEGIRSSDMKTKVDAVLRFLMHHVVFGAVDVTVCRLALTVD